MTDSPQPYSYEVSRRNLLKTLGFTASATAVGTAIGSRSLKAGQPKTADQQPGATGDSTDRQRVAGIDPANLVDEYEARELAAVSDADLYGQVAAIVSKPSQSGLNSFTLHAPLELIARYGLLPLVDPKERPLARLQMVASASAYDDGVVPRDPPARIQPFPNLVVAKKELVQTFRQGDAADMESHVLQIAAQFGTASLVHLLTPLALPTLTGASHSHIGLWLLLRHGRTSDAGDAALLRTASRNLARDPKLQLSSFSGMSISGTKPLKQRPAETEADILAKLANPTRGKLSPPLASFRSFIEAGEETGIADALFGDFIRHDLTDDQMDSAFRAVLRVSAHSMLQDELDNAKLGWSHCLTLPQAACGLSSLKLNRKLGLAATLVWITAYRTVRSERVLDFAWTPRRLEESISILEALQTSPAVAAARVWHADSSELPVIRRTLATEASIRNDQHLVKYTRACIDMGSFDPVHVQLYLAAAAYLCSHWTQERRRNDIMDNLLDGRGTP